MRREEMEKVFDDMRDILDGDIKMLVVAKGENGVYMRLPSPGYNDESDWNSQTNILLDHIEECVGLARELHRDDLADNLELALFGYVIGKMDKFKEKRDCKSAGFWCRIVGEERIVYHG